MKRPRRLFRNRPRPDPDPPVLDLKPGQIYHLVHWHEPACRRPRGGPCTCQQVDVELREPIDPEAN